MNVPARITALLVGAAATAAVLSGCKVPDAPAGGAPGVVYEQDSGPGNGADWSAGCDAGGHVTEYWPRTPAAHTRAVQRCTVLNREIDTAPWPGGYHQLGEVPSQ